MTIRVYEYGLLDRFPQKRGEGRGEDVVKNRDVVLDQITKAHRYYNRLIEIERARRDAFRKIMSTDAETARLKTQLDETSAEIERLREGVRLVRQRRQSAATSRATQARIKDLSTTAKGLRASLKLERARVVRDTEIQAKLEALQKKTEEEVRKARAASGVYWGTYLLVEQAVQAARKSKVDPRFKAWTGSGMVAVQIQHGEKHRGLTTEQIFGDDSRIQIDEPNPAAWFSPVRGERRRESRTTLRLRVGSNGQEPVWASWPMIMHRPLPPGGKIKWAKVLLRKHANWMRWFLQLSIEVPDPVTVEGRSVAVDIGWRAIPGSKEIRFAYWHGDDGRSEEARLPASIRERLEKADSIRGFRDQGLDAMKTGLSPLLDRVRTILPEAIQEQIKTVAAWRAPGRFAGLYFKLDAWAKDPKTSVAARLLVEELLTLLNDWRKRDLHLWQYETGMRKHALLHRREIYRSLAAKLSAEYKVLILEKWDLRSVAFRGHAEDGTRDSREPAHQRQMAGVSIARGCLKNAFEREGGRVEERNPAFTTLYHAACGFTNTWDSASAIEQTCEKCGATIDQDHNAAINLLAGNPVLPGSDQPIPIVPEAPKKKGRWSKKNKKASAEASGVAEEAPKDDEIAA